MCQCELCVLHYSLCQYLYARMRTHHNTFWKANQRKFCISVSCFLCFFFLPQIFTSHKMLKISTHSKFQNHHFGLRLGRFCLYSVARKVAVALVFDSLPYRNSAITLSAGTDWLTGSFSMNLRLRHFKVISQFGFQNGPQLS